MKKSKKKLVTKQKSKKRKSNLEALVKAFVKVYSSPD